MLRLEPPQPAPLRLKQAGHHRAAADALEDAQQRARRVLGPRAPVAVAISHNRGLALSRLGMDRLDEAVCLIRGAMEARREALGEMHPDTLNATSDLGKLLIDSAAVTHSQAAWAGCLGWRRRRLLGAGVGRAWGGRRFRARGAVR